MANKQPGNVLKLVENASVTGPLVNWPGGPGMFTAEATFGGGTVKLQVQTQSAAGTWVDVGSDTTLTAAGAGGFTLPPCNIRASIATATAVYAFVTQM